MLNGVPNIDNYVEYQGKTSKQFGLKILNTYKTDLPDLDLSFTAIPGRSREVISTNNRLANFELNYEAKLYVPHGQSMGIVKRDLANWLRQSSTYSPIYWTDNKEYFYYGVAYKSASTTRIKNGFADVSWSFACDPYMYRRSSFDLIPVKKGVGLPNIDNEIALPLIHVIGNGNITLSIDGVSYSLVNVIGEIYLDSETRRAYTLNPPTLQKLKTQFVNYQYPTLSVDDKNVIDWTGQVTSVEIAPRWRSIAW